MEEQGLDPISAYGLVDQICEKAFANDEWKISQFDVEGSKAYATVIIKKHISIQSININTIL